MLNRALSEVFLPQSPPLNPPENFYMDSEPVILNAGWDREADIRNLGLIVSWQVLVSLRDESTWEWSLGTCTRAAMLRRLGYCCSTLFI
ncbi:hypothetical protein F5Y05DRAFT_364484 [Hypoxylon sp. FL0543]|nr:hypothetical protein F5Y05DRAFT_364484 [Hypoxylon sp. FL0543]